MKKRKKIVILLGAGFPIAWGAPSSDEILKLIMDDEKFMYSDDITWGKFIYDALKSFYEDEGATISFETIIAVSETLMNYVFASTTEGRNTYNTSFVPAIQSLVDLIETEIEKKGSINKKREYIFDMYKHFVDIVLEGIKSYDYGISNPNYEQLNSQINKFVVYLLNKKYSVKIYTTNYDSIIPQILSERNIYTGEHEHATGLDVVYKPDYKKNVESHLSYFSLHGSIYWTSKFIDIRQVIVKSTLVDGVKALKAPGGNPNEPLIFSPIIVGYTKSQRSLMHPFNIGFTNLANDCNDCNRLLTIGYSFSDPHINSILQSNTDFSKVRLVNVGYMDSFEDSQEYQRISSSIRSIYTDKEEDMWFYGQENSVVAFKKGAQEFFLNDDNWGRI